MYHGAWQQNDPGLSGAQTAWLGPLSPSLTVFPQACPRASTPTASFPLGEPMPQSLYPPWATSSRPMSQHPWAVEILHVLPGRPVTGADVPTGFPWGLRDTPPAVGCAPVTCIKLLQLWDLLDFVPEETGSLCVGGESEAGDGCRRVIKGEGC